MGNVKYKRVLIKISGEALGGQDGRGLNFDMIHKVCAVIADCAKEGVEIGLVVGGGNFWRGIKDGGENMLRVRADQMGMLATAINALAVADVLIQEGVSAVVQTAIPLEGVTETFHRGKALEHFSQGTVVVFGCGTGNPYFSTDTAAVLRAAEIGAEVILLAKNVDGVYSADPKTDPSAVKYDNISYEDVLAQRLQVMDSTATALAMDNHIPLLVFALKDPENILKVIQGETLGTVVKN